MSRSDPGARELVLAAIDQVQGDTADLALFTGLPVSVVAQVLNDLKEEGIVGEKRVAWPFTRGYPRAVPLAPATPPPPAEPHFGWVETKRTYRRKTIFGNRRTETIVKLPAQRNARRRMRQRFGVTITEEWRRLG